eukprot:scaffold3808_cov112-Isochrysis_galbana.AAC.43
MIRCARRSKQHRGGGQRRLWQWRLNHVRGLGQSHEQRGGRRVGRCVCGDWAELRRSGDRRRRWRRSGRLRRWLWGRLQAREVHMAVRHDLSLNAPGLSIPCVERFYFSQLVRAKRGHVKMVGRQPCAVTFPNCVESSLPFACPHLCVEKRRTIPVMPELAPQRKQFGALRAQPHRTSDVLVHGIHAHLRAADGACKRPCHARAHGLHLPSQDGHARPKDVGASGVPIAHRRVQKEVG